MILNIQDDYHLKSWYIRTEINLERLVYVPLVAIIVSTQDGEKSRWGKSSWEAYTNNDWRSHPSSQMLLSLSSPCLLRSLKYHLQAVYILFYNQFSLNQWWIQHI